MRKRKRRRKTMARPDHSIRQILAWADAHFARTGKWPNVKSGELYDAPYQKWHAIDLCLRRALRGLPGGSSLARLLADQRGVRNIKAVPVLTAKQILAWADAHFRRTGQWPKRTSGPIVNAPGETWMAVQCALTKGTRGLPGGSSLSLLLAKERGVRNHLSLPPLTAKGILAWADAHHRHTGEWPRDICGPLVDAPAETWSGVDAALTNGCRGLPGGSSLPRLLAEHRGVRNSGNPPRLRVEDILA
jgi:hypothetical protein